MYIHTEAIHNTKSAEAVVPIILNLFNIKSVLDVGCGTGTWLKVFHDYGIKDICGIDGVYVDINSLVIESKYYKALDLCNEFNLNKYFDLVICLEVAEHLPEESAEKLVQSLVNHSDIIIFSAAIPGQGGQNHLNEQWPLYWSNLFKTVGFERYDLIRPYIWTERNVDIWYRQNIFVFSKYNLCQELKSIAPEIHPELWSAKIQLLETLQQEVYNFDKGGAGIKRSFCGLLSALLQKIRK